MSMDRKLFEEFPPVTTGQWMEKITADLKGADFNRKLLWKTIGGFDVRPFYREEDLAGLPFINSLPGEFPFVRTTGKTDNRWYVREEIEVTDPIKANAKALNVLSRGADSVAFHFPADTMFNRAMIEHLLESIFLEAIEISFVPGNAPVELLKTFRDVVESRGIRPSLVKGAIETDPLGRLMVNGKLCVSVNEAMDYLVTLYREGEFFPAMKMVRVNGAAFGNAGASAVQELGMTLAMGNEYLAQLTERGITPDEAAGKTGFTFSTGSSYFIEIAKLRVARMLWAAIVKRYSPEEEESMKMNIHSVTSEWNKTVYDPYVNMLRTQTEAMSATLGGADSLTVGRFDQAFAAPGEFSERIARNQQLLLKEESHFDKVADPAAGSYYIENVTASLANHAWELFLDIEEKGGFLECLKSGFIQSAVAETREKRLQNVAMGKERLLGTNIYPGTAEKAPQFSARHAEEIKGETADMVEPLRQIRAAEEFEKLRMSTEKSDKRPAVFMLTAGNPVMRKARAQFSSGFFGVAGYEIIDNPGFDNIGEGVAMALKMKADIIVLCSSDEEYEQFAPEAASLIKGKAVLVIAGAPAAEASLRDQGIENFISLRSNILETLHHYNRLLGIE